MSKKEEVKVFYDEYVLKQEKIGINSRHISIIDKLVQSGLKSNHKVLEVGCGIGTVSQLIAKKTSKGKILAVDISEKSIEKAKILWKQFSNLSFEVSDMSDFTKSGQTFDYFVFPDVLEHIPVDQHPNLFERINAHSHKDSVVFIHIPAPRFLQYNINNEPDKLQIIDQPLDTATLVGVLRDNRYYLDKMETYAVFFEEKDYQYFVFRRNNKITKNTLRGKWPVFMERTFLKIKNSIFL
ncbi:class I SAM-dependent methyltransferase [Aquiflexum sp. TKW24L]|uniref:class I SAM-dependent methyltransferase n=1 Tax=Aquiflexum sp. TKW24L TaxID=2942212 RepID=UPI0020BFFC7B|nr:class I SAM-dependent methyltransferase [Aquiflexum sp. TKW24L]MCL6258781.1 class I SAM-dependent methyltransferase [Aquiflexum sp. TKW24L]